jgi:hypothetical protein
MLRRQLNISMVTVGAAILCGVSARAQEAAIEAAPEPEPSSLLLRLGASVGGGYTTNLYLNASALDDTLGLAKLTFNGNWLATSDLSLKLNYIGDGELTRTVTNERHWGHSGDLTLGYRALDALFATLAVGGEQAYYPSNRGSVYSFWGLFGRAGGRLELGESATLKVDYRYRQDQFPKYDLDNRSHLAWVEWNQALSETLELRLPVTFESTYYLERFVAAQDGSLTGEHRTAQRWRLEPTIVVMPSFDLRLTGSLAGEKNLSNDTYYYAGPFGVATPTVNPALIAHYDTYTSADSTWELRWDVADSLTAVIHVNGGYRQFDKRPAFDANGLDTGKKERDTWVQPGLEARWRLTDVIGLSVNYSYLRQWSNDALWDFDAHRIEAFIDTWWGD